MSGPTFADHLDERRGVNRRILWAILVAFVFSLIANIVLAVFLSLPQKNSAKITEFPQTTGDTYRNGSARAGKASGEPAENTYWGKLEIARTAAMTVDYKGFRVLLYQTRSDPKLYYFVPAMILRSSSVKSVRNILLDRYQLEFTLTMYDDAYIAHLKSEVYRLVKIRAELRVIPMEELRIDAAAALLPDYEVDNNWKPYTRHPSEMTFRIFCVTETACLAAKDYVLRFPQDFVSNLNVQISLQSQVSNSRRVTISAEHISNSKLFTELNQRMKGKDDVFLVTDDVKKLEQEVAQNLMAAEVTDAELVSQESSPTLMGLIDSALHMTQASSEGFDKYKWNSVFWQDENARPDKVTSMVNEAYERLDSETREMIKSAASTASSQNLCVNVNVNRDTSAAAGQGVTEAGQKPEVTKNAATTKKAPAATAKPGKRSVPDGGVQENMPMGVRKRLDRLGRQASTVSPGTFTSALFEQTNTAVSTVDAANSSVNGSDVQDEESVKEQDTLKLIFGLMVLQTVNPNTYADLMAIVRTDARMERECSPVRETALVGDGLEASSATASLDTCDLFVARRLVEVTQEIAAASTLGQAVATSIGSTQEKDITTAAISATTEATTAVPAAVDSAAHDLYQPGPEHMMSGHNRKRRGILSALGSIGNIIGGAIGQKPGVGGIVAGIGNMLKPGAGNNPLIQNIASSVGQFLNVNPAGTGSNPLNTIMQNAISGIGQSVDPFISSLMQNAASSIAQGKNPSISSLIRGLAGHGDNSAIKGLIQNAASSIGKGSDAFINTFLQNAASSISQGINPSIESLARNAAASLGQAANSSISSLIQNAAASLEKVQTEDPFVKSLFQSAAASIGKGHAVNINSLIENAASAIGKVNNSAQSLIQHAASSFGVTQPTKGFGLPGFLVPLPLQRVKFAHVPTVENLFTADAVASAQLCRVGLCRSLVKCEQVRAIFCTLCQQKPAAERLLLPPKLN